MPPHSAANMLRVALAAVAIISWGVALVLAFLTAVGRSGGPRRWFVPLWSSTGLSDQGLRHRRLHVRWACVGTLAALAAALV